MTADDHAPSDAPPDASPDRDREEAPREPSRESRRREGDAPTLIGGQLQSPLAGRVDSDPESLDDAAATADESQAPRSHPSRDSDESAGAGDDDDSDSERGSEASGLPPHRAARAGSRAGS